MAIALSGPRRRATTETGPGLLGPLVGATLLAAGTELVLLRLISRIGVHIPALTWARTGYEAAVITGNIAFPVATVFAAALLLFLARSLAGRAFGAALAMLTLLGFQIWLLIAPAGASGAALHAFLLAVVLAAVLLAAVHTGLGRRPLLFLVLITGAQILATMQAGSAQLVALGGAALPLTVTELAELLLLAGLLATPLLLTPPRWTRRSLIAAGLVALITAGALSGNDSTTRILAIWTFGLQMPAHPALYVLAAGVLTATATANWQSGRTATAAGLALLALGGFVPPSSYQADLMLAGLVLLAFPRIGSRHLPRATSWQPAPATRVTLTTAQDSDTTAAVLDPASR